MALQLPRAQKPCRTPCSNNLERLLDRLHGLGRWAKALLHAKALQLCKPHFGEAAFDPNITHFTYLSSGYRWKNGVGVNLNFGMGRHNFGRASLGSVVQSDWLTDLPYGTLRFYSPIFTYAFNIQQLNQKEIMYTHEIDFRLWRRFTFGFVEGGAAYDVFDMRFLNPFGIFHAYELNNQFDWISYMGVKFNYVPCKKFAPVFLNRKNRAPNVHRANVGPGRASRRPRLAGRLGLAVPGQRRLS